MLEGNTSLLFGFSRARRRRRRLVLPPLVTEVLFSPWDENGGMGRQEGGKGGKSSERKEEKGRNTIVPLWFSRVVRKTRRRVLPLW